MQELTRHEIKQLALTYIDKRFSLENPNVGMGITCFIEGFMTCLQAVHDNDFHLDQYQQLLSSLYSSFKEHHWELSRKRDELHMLNEQYREEIRLLTIRIQMANADRFNIKQDPGDEKL